jgi:hypothetical protein
MPLEEMTISIGPDGHVRFTGDFTFNFIPDGNCGFLPCEAVTKMQFPLPPVNPSNVAVFQDGVALPWSISAGTYPTILPDYPNLALFEWAGPFPKDGAVFTVDYEHEVITRDSEWTLFYSLGTGKVFPTYDKVTTALFDITLPREVLRSLTVMLDDTTVDPGAYTVNGNQLSLELNSNYGPFTRDLIVKFEVPTPGTLWLVAIALAGVASRRRAR